MRCLIIPRLIDKSAVAPKYHKGYTADIDLVNVPRCDYDSLLSAMSAVCCYDTDSVLKIDKIAVRRDDHE